MAESGLKRLWNAIKPPPPVPWHSSEQAGGLPESELSAEEHRRRKRLLIITAVAIAMGGVGWAAYSYIASAPQRADAALQEGMRLMASGQYKGAEERFTRATEIFPSLATGYLERGLAHLNLHEPDLAIKDFEHAIDLNPNFAEAHTALGGVYRERGDLKHAVGEFTLAINLGSAVDANYQRAQMYESLGEHQKALEDYNQAIAGLPDAPYVYRARAVTREILGDAAGAKQDRHTADLIEHPELLKPTQ